MYCLRIDTSVRDTSVEATGVDAKRRSEEKKAVVRTGKKAKMYSAGGEMVGLLFGGRFKILKT